jgi:hypothetical protein
MVNLHRIYLFWDLAAAHFLLLSNSKQTDLRKYSMEVLNNIVNMGFGFFLNIFKNGKEKKENQDLVNCLNKIENWNLDNWQSSLFQPYIDII